MYYIFGAGISGIAAAKFILAKNISPEVTIIDDNIRENALLEKMNGYSNYNLKTSKSDLKLVSSDTLIPSPGISPDTDVYSKFRNAGCKIVSEIELALSKFTGQIIAITGTNGKSTTTKMCEFLLRKIGIDAVASGNIGLPPTEVLLHKKQPEILVLELSSYQLEISKKIGAKVCIFTNFGPDHLDRHKTIQNYFAAKWNLIDGSPNTHLILDDTVENFALGSNKELPEQRSNIDNFSNWKGLELSPLCTGVHNQKNAFMAMEATRIIIDKDFNELADSIRDFNGLEHRCEVIDNDIGITIINDSKSTNVASTTTALSAFKMGLVLVLGGIAKKESFTELQNFSHIKRIFCFGESRDKISSELEDFFEVEIFEEFDQAIKRSFEYSKKYSIGLLFSPACASFDQFLNFEKRGEAFKQLIKKLLL